MLSIVFEKQMCAPICAGPVLHLYYTGINHQAGIRFARVYHVSFVLINYTEFRAAFIIP